jgi:hypothetical protein
MAEVFIKPRRFMVDLVKFVSLVVRKMRMLWGLLAAPRRECCLTVFCHKIVTNPAKAQHY